MKKINKMLASKSLIYTVAVLISMLSSLSIFAQPGGGGPIPPYVMPLTGGIGALLGIGIATGVYFYRNRKSKKN